MFDTNLSTLSESKFVNWPIPAITHAKGPPMRIDQDCKFHHDFPPILQKPMGDLVDALLYLGPQDLRLREKIPADIALDVNYRAELQKGAAMFGFPKAASETPQEFDREIVNGAEDPLFAKPIEPPDPKEVKPMVEGCLERKLQNSPSR
jgi:hypothetical protein